MKKTKLNSKTLFLCFMCCFVYFTSYMTRINYAAVLVEIISDLGVSKEIGSIAVTGSFIVYGVGQLISGVLGDFFQPKNIIIIGLLGTSIINISMAFLPNIYAMTVVWCFNGLFQAMMWPPLLKIMAENLEDKIYSRTAVCVSASASIATIFIYLLAPVLIAISGWRLVFIISASIGIVCIIMWYINTKDMHSDLAPKRIQSIESKNSNQPNMLKIFIEAGLVMIMVSIILQGILRDGITTWMPTYVKEVFDLGTSVSILTAVILPVFSIISVSVASIINKYIKNEIMVASILYGAAFIASVLMVPMFEASFIFSALMMALITGCMHGVNLMLISRLPLHFKKYGRVSTISGLLNACTYVGSALSTYGFAVLSEKFGWYFIIISWVIISAIGSVICIASVKRWNMFKTK